MTCRWRLAAVLGAATIAGAVALAEVPPADEAVRARAVVVGLDHIPIAVNDLDAAAAHYRELGFTLKPGTLHDNGIRNQHAKFADGTELELITAPKAVDPLTATYRRHLTAGDGPAFLAFYAPAMARLGEQLDAVRQAYRMDRGFIDIPSDDPLGYIFFGPRNRSPTDRPEHFVHANTAESLLGVWIAADNLSRERRLLRAVGATFSRRVVRAPDRLTVDVARLPEGEVLLLPAARQLVSGRRVVGATLRVASLDKARAALSRFDLLPGGGVDSTRLVLPPSVTHGIWLELREGRSDDPAGRGQAPPLH
jgi:catechol 2,3-dioxygenase-like lactoylglutathione lyase family enzyme